MDQTERLIEAGARPRLQASPANARPADPLRGMRTKELVTELARKASLLAKKEMVYDQWTQFEEFPRFMEGVEEVHQLDDKTLHWKAKIGGKTEEWTAEIVQQNPHQSIAWRHTRGAVNRGAVTFTPLDGERRRVTLALEYDPKGFVERVGDVLGVVSRRVEGDLQRFKRFIEERGAETGAWRGEIRPGGDPTHHP